MSVPAQRRDIMEIIRSKDGTPIAAWRSGVGAPLLLVHGATGDHTGWTPVRVALERHFSVWTLDRRGGGARGGGPPSALGTEGEEMCARLGGIGRGGRLPGPSL